MTLTGVEFIRRLLLHVLPPGFTKLRYYGLLGNNRRRHRITAARRALQSSPWRWEPKTIPPPPTPPPLPTCPHCQGTQLRCIGRLEPSGTLRLFARARFLLGPPAFADSS